MSTEPVLTEGVDPAPEQIIVDPSPLTLGPGFRSARRWASVAVILLALEAALMATGAAFASAGAGAEWRFEAGLVGLADLNAFRQIVSALVGAAGLVELLTAVPFLVWLYRSMRNAPRVGAPTTAYSPRKAVIVWFVPFANFVLPYRIVRDLHDRLASPDTGRAGRRLVRAWWIFWLTGAGLVGATRLTANPGEDSFLLALSWTAYFVAAVLAVAVVRRVQRLADVREARLTGRDAQAAVIDARARRRRIVVVPAGLATVGALLLLAQLGSVASGRPAGAAWATFTSTAGSFAISLPRVPTDVPGTVATGAEPAVSHTFSSRLDAQESYAVTYVDFPAGSLSAADPAALLERVGTVTVGTNEQIGNSVISRDAVPGLGVEFRMPTGDVVNIRYYLDGDRMYGLEVDTTADRASSPNIARFFDSFTLRP
jgi:hypothetical protein